MFKNLKARIRSKTCFVLDKQVKSRKHVEESRKARVKPVWREWLRKWWAWRGWTESSTSIRRGTRGPRRTPGTQRTVRSPFHETAPRTQAVSRPACRSRDTVGERERGRERERRVHNSGVLFQGLCSWGKGKVSSLERGSYFGCH